MTATQVEALAGPDTSCLSLSLYSFADEFTTFMRERNEIGDTWFTDVRESRSRRSTRYEKCMKESSRCRGYNDG